MVEKIGNCCWVGKVTMNVLHSGQNQLDNQKG